jgi:hypothetical protein
METLELPLAETPEDEMAPGSCIESDIDLAALELWRQASVPESWDEQD